MFNLPVFLFITPMFLFSGVFFPISSLPVWAQCVAWGFPLTFLVSLIRDLSLGIFSVYALVALVVLVFIAVACTFVSMLLLHKRILK